MITPAFWCTIVIANHAMIRYGVPRDTLTISTAGIDLKKITYREMETFTSPREKKNGEIFYLSNGIVSWLNCRDVDQLDMPLRWKDEVNMLTGHGLEFGKDMVRVQWHKDELYTLDDNQFKVDCQWIKLVCQHSAPFQNRVSDAVSGAESEGIALLWVNPRKMFKGYHLETIKVIG